MENRHEIAEKGGVSWLLALRIQASRLIPGAVQWDGD